MEPRSRPWLSFLAAAEDELLAQPDRAREGLQVGAVDDRGALDGQAALGQLGKAAVKLVGDDELQHGVAEEFQPLVVGQPLPLFVAEGGVGERPAAAARAARSDGRRAFGIPRGSWRAAGRGN